MRSKVIAVLLGLAASVSSACSTYTPITLQLAPQAGTVRLALSGDARAQSFGLLGSEIESIEGKVRSISDSTITIAAAEVGRADSDAASFRGETVAIPSRYVVSVSQKRVQLGRSLLLAAAITGGVVWIGHSLGGGNVDVSKPPTPQPGH